MDLNLQDMTWAMLQMSFGFGFAGHFLGKAIRKNAAMKAMRPANRSIATHQVMRVASVMWNVALLMSVLAFCLFSAVYYPSNSLRNPIPWDTIGSAAAFYLSSLAIIRLIGIVLRWHDKFQDTLFIAGGVAMIFALAVSTPGLLIGSIIIFIIAWKIIGSQGYADGMVLRDYMIDKARYFDGRRWRRR